MLGEIEYFVQHVPDLDPLCSSMVFLHNSLEDNAFEYFEQVTDQGYGP